jgi:hypothetical protein
MTLPPTTQKLIDAFDFRAEQLEMQHTARQGIIVSGPTTAEARLKGERAWREARKLRRYIQQLISKHHQN